MPSAYDNAPDSRSLQARFEAFHRDNPHVYAELVKLARRARGRGVARIGIKMLWEVLRWQLQIETYHPDADSFRLNNNFHSLYARLLMDENPELRDLFETRESPRK
jgi:predicted GNAT superfamily acetyltransferase